jgi:hypothetical protein
MFFVGFVERKQSSILRLGCVVVAVVCGALVLPAQAGEGDKAIARAHYETATRLYEVREYADALKEYKAAYVAKPDPAFLFNIGQCYRKMDKNAEALNFFQEFLKKASPDEPNRALVEARIRNIEAGLNSNYDPFDKSAAQAPALVAPAPVAPAQPGPASEPIVPPAPVQLLPTNPGLPAAQPDPRPSVAPPPQPAGVDFAAALPAGEVQGSAPIFTTWWFWTGVGAVVVAGTVTAVALSSGGGTKNPGSTLGSRSVFQ